MAISASMQNNILALTAGMFNMSAGGTYLTSFAGYVSGVQNTYNLSDDAAMAELARALVKTDVFKTQMAGKVTADAQANAILSNFGLAGDAALVASTAAAIDSFGTNNTDGELAALIWGYTKALTQDTAAMAKYAAATAAMAAKVATAVETSVTNPIQSTDMSVLKAAFVAPATTFTIKTGLDNVTGTAGNDTFSADLAGNSNTFESGDSINGGTGTDKLQIVLGDASNFAISAHTTAIETVAIQTQAVTRDSNNNNMIGTNQIQYSQGSQVDAQNMSGVTRWEDNNSRADLVVEDVRIGATQITKDVTIAMVSTDPGNVDYGVYFDQGSLRAAAPTTSGSTLSIEWMDTRAAIAGQDPLKDISYSGFKFNVDGKSVTVQSAAIDAATTYDALLAAVKTAVAANADLAKFTVSFGADFTAVDTSTGTTAIGKTIALTNTAAGVLTAGSVLTATNEVPSSSGFHTLAKVGAPATATSIITSTIVLDDVGRGSMGGDLVVGGLSVGDTSTSKGIDRFEITVENNSKLQTINSTNNALKEVQIVNGTTKGDLTVTGNVAYPGTGSLTGQTGTTPGADTTVIGSLVAGAANSDNGPLPGNAPQHNQYGFSDVRVLDASTMVGKVNVTAELTKSIAAKYALNAKDTAANQTADNQTFKYDLGTNSDTLAMDISAANLDAAGTTTREDFVLSITGGAGDDSIATRIVNDGSATSTTAATLAETTENGSANWYVNSKQNANLTIDAGIGNDTVRTIGGGDFKVNAGEGNDTVYLDNSGAKATWAFNVQNNTTATAAVANATNTNGTTGVTATDNASSTTTVVNNVANPVGAGSEIVNNNLESIALVTPVNLTGAKLTVTFSSANGEGATGVSEAASVASKVGFESTVSIPTLAGGMGTQAQVNAAIKDAINNNAVLNKLLVATDGPANTLVVTSLIDGGMSATDLRVDITAGTATGTTTQATLDAAVSMLQDTVGAGYYTGSGHAAVTAAMATPAANIDAVANVNTVATTSTIAVDAGTAMFETTAAGVALSGSSSTKAADNHVTLGTGDDVLVMGTGDYSNDTVIYTGTNNGNDTIVNMNVANLHEVVNGTMTSSDVFDFTAYGVTSAATVHGLITQAAGGGAVTVSDASSVTLNNNEIAVVRFTGTATDTFANLNATNFLNAINTAGDTNQDLYGELDTQALNAGVVVTATVTGEVTVATNTATQNDVVFVENAANLGEYKMFHLVANGISSDFTSAEYIGSVDLGASFGGSADAAYTAVAAGNAGNITPVTAAVVTPGATLSASVASVDEGSAVTFTLANQAAGTYNVTVTGTGITTGDYTTVTSVTVGADGTGTFAIDATADATTEGAETMLVSVAGLSQSVVINDTSLNGTPTASVAVTTTGSVTDTAAINTTYTVTAGTNYTYNIAGFGAGDKLVFPAGNTPSVVNDDWADGIVDLTYASSGTVTTIHLTGLSTANDGALNDLAGFNTVFGAGTIA